MEVETRDISLAGRIIAVFSDLSDAMQDQLRTRGIPFVVVDPTGEPHHDTPSVGATNWNGGLTATRRRVAQQQKQWQRVDDTHETT